MREERRPAVLHLRTVRYLSHAGADLETAYRTPQAIRADYERDPILATARWLVAEGAATGEALADEYLESRERIRELALAATQRPQLEDADDVMRPLAPRSPIVVASRVGSSTATADEPLTLAQAINQGLADVLEQHPETLLFGEDVAVKGGVYGVTRGLHARFGAARVFDTLLDETSILGLALGAAVTGFVPLPGDPVPRVPAQRRGSAAWRGGHAAVLLAGPLPERDGRPGRGLRLPAGLRRALPQRRLGRGTARHPGSRGRLAVPARGRRPDAADVCGRGEGRRQRLRVPRADCALPRP